MNISKGTHDNKRRLLQEELSYRQEHPVVYSCLGTHIFKACKKRRKQAWPVTCVLLPILVAKVMGKTFCNFR